MKNLDIGEVATQSGLPASTLRYYEEKGLISSIGRQGLRRQFGPDTPLRLALVALGKSAGFSLEDIAEMFGDDGQPKVPREELHKRADELERQIRNLTTLQNALRHVADCSAPSHLECPKFQQLLRLAGRRRQSHSLGS